MANNNIITTTPTLTTSSNNTTDESGLYVSYDTNDGNPTYYFRGNVTNNYVEFAGYTWRIVRINEDETVRLIMQDGINNNSSFAFAPGNEKMYMYYTNSNAKVQLESWYKTNIDSYTKYSNNLATGDYFCEQAKVAVDSNYSSNSGANMALYTSYTPNFKCEKDANEKGIVNAAIGLINYDEVVFAGGYYGKINNSYYLYDGAYYWTMSNSGYHSTGYSGIWTIHLSNGMAVSRSGYGDYYRLRPVINLKADTIVVGSGTSNDPYKLESLITDMPLTYVFNGNSNLVSNGNHWSSNGTTGTFTIYTSPYISLSTAYTRLNITGSWSTHIGSYSSFKVFAEVQDSNGTAVSTYTLGSDSSNSTSSWDSSDTINLSTAISLSGNYRIVIKYKASGNDILDTNINLTSIYFR